MRAVTPPGFQRNIDAVQRAFSAQAPIFDSYEKQNRILQWMRSQVYSHEEKFLRPGDSILELNAGTGIDAIHFASSGHRVFAIDNAPGMIKELRAKAEHAGLLHLITAAVCSFTDLHTLLPERFDHVFSNFGGLNCVPNLHSVSEQLPRLLRPGATVTLVVMPRVCPWELLHLVTGDFRFTLRRFLRNGTPAQIEGHHFRSYYFSPREILRSFGDRFTLLRLKGLACFTPPPAMETFPIRFPRLYRILNVLDEKTSTLPPFNRWADHFIVTMRYDP